jgi:3-oxoacyl-[acyl-carrier protein] reductase
MTLTKATGLQGRVALVTGANHGIGAAIARSLAEAGCAVFLHFLRMRTVDAPGATQRMQDATRVVTEIRKADGRAESWEADLAVPASIPELFDRAEGAFGGVEIVVNNAAVSEHDTFDPRADARDWAGRLTAQLTSESHDRHFAVNTRAVALMMAEQARRHVARSATWGRIINVSTDGSASFPGEVSYGASKYAMESYSRAAAWELGQFGITVNVVSPGPTDTGWITPEMVEGMRRATPLGRVGTPQDIADVVCFLASEQARWITGQLHFVGGGHRMI